ncbi:MAG: PKD domain-containing protein [Chitinophagaceae bacterium]|nr:PKD domain-containing protein [Chitinophagaceae bacterium]MCW5905436.1 PKD domain-containing protein [Chitinophagaceae bacterium]
MSIVCFAQKPVANFTANVQEGCAPLIVQFTDASTNNPTQWNWDLGNGVISTQQNPATSYLNPGIYTVKLIAINSIGEDTVIKTNYIVVNDVPTVDFNASVTSGCYPLKVQFTDASIANSGNITQWFWDFGDGNTSTQQNPLHTYSVAGSFTVTLKVTNSKGCTKQLNKPNYINVPGGVYANFSVVSATNCTLPANISFTNTSSGTGTLSYEWNFGDGATSTQTTPSHTYTNNGTYTVSLIVKNNNGCNDTLIKPNIVNVGTVNADFTYTGQCVNAPTTFTSTSTPTPIAYTWYFGSAATSTQVNPQHTFPSPLNYNVKLVADFGTCKDSMTKSITINPKPNAAFTNTPLGGCVVPLAINFSSTAPNITSYQWSFGDGGTSTQQSPSYTYSQQGNFNVTLIAENAAGCRDTVTKNNAVVIAPPHIITFSQGAPYSGCAPYTSAFGVYVQTLDPVATYEWDFGDGTPLVIADTPTHTYQNTGFYTIQVIVTTVNGCKDTLTYNTAIKLYDKPTANFTATPVNACAKNNITFTSLSSPNATTWFWDFGDGGTSTLENPIYNYSDTGSFNVRLIVSNNSCKDTLQIDDYIYINPPVAKFQINFNCDTPFQRRFIDESKGALTYLWDFGDGNISSLANPVHSYTALGGYNVKLIVTNGACVDSATAFVPIVDINATFSTIDTAYCKYANVLFNVSNTTSSDIVHYAWSFGDGVAIAGSNLDTIPHTYINNGHYNPQLIVIDGAGCSDTITNAVPIIIYGPKADFANPAGTCINGTINFTDNSLTDGLHNITQVIWFYGDGASDTLTAPPYIHQYNDTGFYHVQIKVTDDFGCYDTLQKNNAVQITKPFANFYASDTLQCANSNIQFTNFSQGVNLSHEWDFGDGNISSQTNPAHAFATQGFYDVQLTITDIFGCIDTLVKPQYIEVANSVADFNFIQGDTLGLCYPFLIQVANNSTNTTSVSWNFGDGGNSNLDTPAHFYNYAGIYSLTLKAYGYGGCVDSMKKNIVVRGPTGTFTYSPIQFCSPTIVNFSAHTQNNAIFMWDFADGVVTSSSDSTTAHTYIIPGSFKPNMILIDSAGCQVTVAGLDTIKVAGVETFIKVPQTQFCDSVQLNFLDSTEVINDVVTNYLWNFGNGVTSTQKNPQHFYNQTGNYTVTLQVTTSLGCTNSDTLQAPINVVQTPEIDITAVADACIFDSIQYYGLVIKSDTNTLYWQWNLGNGNVSTLQNPLLQQYQTLGNYTITAISYNAVGCADTVQKIVTIHPLPNVDAGNNTFVCKGSNITLNPSGANTYIWFSDTTLSCTSCTNPIAKPDSTTIYQVTGYSNFGCIATDSVMIEVIHPFALSISSNDTLCVGSSVQLSAFGNADNYSWQPTTGLNNANIKNPIASPQQTTVYSVIATDNKSCFTDTASVEIKVYPIPQFDIVENLIQANVGTTIPLSTTNSSDITTWRWLPTKWLSCYDCPSPIATITDKIKYIAEASNPGGCFSRDEVTIEPLCNGYNVFIPNTFSPNNDGVNDVFYVRGKGLFAVRSMKVFNRLGEVVFNKLNISANNPLDGWDGTYKGKKLTADVYVYVIEVVCDNSQVMNLKGNIMLLR